jgi:hypothetical protein
MEEGIKRRDEREERERERKHKHRWLMAGEESYKINYSDNIDECLVFEYHVGAVC